jgi:hypothetical protein
MTLRVTMRVPMSRGVWIFFWAAAVLQLIGITAGFLRPVCTPDWMMAFHWFTHGFAAATIASTGVLLWLSSRALKEPDFTPWQGVQGVARDDTRHDA